MLCSCRAASEGDFRSDYETVGLLTTHTYGGGGTYCGVRKALFQWSGVCLVPRTAEGCSRNMV
jgi:hypothetical protein